MLHVSHLSMIKDKNGYGSRKATTSVLVSYRLRLIYDFMFNLLKTRKNDIIFQMNVFEQGIHKSF